MKNKSTKTELDQEKLKNLGGESEDEVDRQMRDLRDLPGAANGDDDEMETVQDDDSDVDEMKRIIQETKTYEDEEEDENEDGMSDLNDDDAVEGEDNEDEEMEDESEQRFGESSDEGEATDKKSHAKGASGK